MRNYDYGSAWIASEIASLTHEIRYARIKKENEEFWKEWSKQLIFEFRFKEWIKEFNRIISGKWFILWQLWNFLIFFTFGSIMASLGLLSIIFWAVGDSETFKFFYSWWWAFLLIFWIFRCALLYSCLSRSGVIRFKQLQLENSNQKTKGDTLVFNECKSVCEELCKYLRKPYLWMPARFAQREIFNRLYSIVAITCDPDELEGLAKIKITKLLNNLQKDKKDLDGRVMLVADFNAPESPITLWKFSLLGRRFSYIEDSKFTYNFSEEETREMKQELEILEESKNVF